MKKALIIILVLASIQVFAQTDGISYQAVIIGPNNQELPGVDAEGNILPDATIALRFTIIDSNNQLEYQEIQTTNTDQYGRINLLIGEVDPDSFAEISWDGTNKDLKVEIDFNGGSNFVDMSREKLTFLPYAYHRNITATGTLTVDDATFLNGELTVQGPTNLNSTLDVNNNNTTNLSGELNVEGVTSLNNSLEVAGTTVFNDSIYVSNQANSRMSGNLTVEGELNALGTTTFEDLVVNGTTALRGVTTIDTTTTILGQVTIKPTLEEMNNTGLDSDYTKYPLLVEGSDQGIAIKVESSRGTENNYISFWDNTGTNNEPVMWGRIEGLHSSQMWSDSEFLHEFGIRTADVAINLGELGIWGLELLEKSTVKLPSKLTSSTACVGLGACVTTPIPSLIVESNIDIILKIANLAAAGANLALAGAELATFITFNEINIGVSYQSGAGDYAEWLPKLNPLETFNAGELVGVKNGLVTKKTWGVEKIMIVSTNPIVLGNMPQPNNEKEYVKIAFMGQVPVRVLGDVSPGDYILPSILRIGFAKAVHPKDMKTNDYKNIAGVAWNVIDELNNGVSLVNVAVGINNNDLSEIVTRQDMDIRNLKEEYNQLKNQIQKSNTVLSSLLPGYSEALGIAESNNMLSEPFKDESQQDIHLESNIIKQGEDDIVYFKISDDQIESAIEMTRELYIDMVNNKGELSKIIPNGPFEKENSKKGLEFLSINNVEDIILIPIEDHPFWQKIDTDPSYVQEIKDFIKSRLEKGMHTHKKYAHKFTDLKELEN